MVPLLLIYTVGVLVVISSLCVTGFNPFIISALQRRKNETPERGEAIFFDSLVDH